MTSHVHNKESIKKLPDEELAALVHYSDLYEEVFYEIVARYKQKIYYLVRKILISHDDADDAAQNTFIRVWENLGSFKGNSRLFTWLYRIAYNEALALLRKKREHLNLDDVSSELGQYVDEGLYMSGDAIQARLQKAILKLPEKQRLVFNLKYFEDLPYEEISEITGTSVGGLKANYFHAVKKLEEYLQVGLNQ